MLTIIFLVQICVNDDLVIKKFACYLSSTEKNKASSQKSEDDDNFEPEMSPCQLSLPTMDLCKESRSPAEILWPGFMQGTTLKQGEFFISGSELST